MDSIYLGNLKPDTLAAIRRHYAALDMENIALATWWQAERVCELYFLLKYAPDDAELFPHGKWATLQAIEELIAAALASDTDPAA